MDKTPLYKSAHPVRASPHVKDPQTCSSHRNFSAKFFPRVVFSTHSFPRVAPRLASASLGGQAKTPFWSLQQRPHPRRSPTPPTSLDQMRCRNVAAVRNCRPCAGRPEGQMTLFMRPAGPLQTAGTPILNVSFKTATLQTTICTRIR